MQAKQQLADAQGLRVQNRGLLLVARNAYRSVFGTDPGQLNSMVKPKLPLALLPETVGEAVRVALRENPQLTATHSTARVVRETVKTAKTTFLPRFDRIGQSTFEEDSGGTLGHQQESAAKVQLSFPFNLGFTAVNTLKAAESDTTAADHRVIELGRVVEEQVA